MRQQRVDGRSLRDMRRSSGDRNGNNAGSEKSGRA
jgi:hypothetical protein